MMTTEANVWTVQDDIKLGNGFYWKETRVLTYM